MGSARGFAVLDFETTGFASKKNDRVIEVGVVLLDKNLDYEGSFETLVQPNRDVGRTDIHGITPSFLLGAPTFAEIAPELCATLDGRVWVGHNARFDLDFMFAELKRMGVVCDDPAQDVVCTLHLARQIYGSLPRKLGELCQALDLPVFDGHKAIIDAQATAQLLRHMAFSSPQVSNFLSNANPIKWPKLATKGAVTLLQREARENELSESFIRRLVAKLPLIQGDASTTEYVSQLDFALVDALLSESEIIDLLDLALESELSVSDVKNIHAQYFRQLVNFAWQDGILEPTEISRIRSIGQVLGISEIEVEESLLHENPAEIVDTIPHINFGQTRILEAGAEIALTGAMQPSKSVMAKMISSLGFQVSETLTKRTKLLIAADVESKSGKAIKALSWGIEVISTDAFIKRYDLLPSGKVE